MLNLGMDTEIMNSFLKILAAAIMLLGSSSSAYSEAEWTNSGYIQEVQATTSGVLVVRGKMGGNPSGCKDGDSYYADYSTKGTEKIFSLLLQSIAARNRVKLFVTGRCDLNGMSEISAAAIYAE